MIKRSHLINTTVTAILMGLAMSGSAMASIHNTNPMGTPVSFKSQALVAGCEVKADSLVKSGDEKVRKELAAIQLGNIPNPLGELVLDRETISEKLGDLASSVEIPEKVSVKRLGAILKGADVKAKIEEYCQNNSSDKLNFDFSKLASTIVLPGNAISWNITPNSDNELGLRVFALNAETEGGPFQQLVQVRISKTIEAAQLCQLVKPGEVITESMVKPVSVLIKNERSNQPVAYRDIIGKTLDRFKSAGTVIRSSELADAGKYSKVVSEPQTISNAQPSKSLNMMAAASKNDVEMEDWLIKPGESVEFRVNSGSLSLTIPAKAVQGGNTGDEIELINIKNKRRISGIVTEKGVVEYAQK